MTTSPTVAAIRTEGRLLAREPIALFWIIGFPSILLVLLGLIPSFREESAELGGQSLIQLYVGTLVLLSMIVAAGQAMPEVLIGYRQRRVLRRLQTTPLGPARLILAQAVVYAGAIVAAAVLCLAIGRVAFGAPLPQAPGAYLLTFLLALAAMLSVGAVVTAVAPNPAVGNVLAMAVLFSFMFTAGVWLPVQAMPDTLAQVVGYTPMGAATEALNQATLGEFPDLVHLAVTAGWTVVLSLVAVRTFRWE
ncbi:ABC transporter permease [Nocardioides sp. BGMRC 2183]|nr:ABC transporter permease [Nocardioides sp. BGMRC 2183]